MNPNNNRKEYSMKKNLLFQCKPKKKLFNLVAIFVE